MHHLFTFSRKLEGGRVVGLPGFTFVPEKVVRKCGFEHGDLLSIAEIINMREEGKYRYKFALEQKVRKKAPNRVQFDRCVVLKNRHLLCLDKLLVFRGIRLRLKQSCIDRFNIVEGDVVDIALPATNPYHMKVIWKYTAE